jgi:hypothetical protein
MTWTVMIDESGTDGQSAIMTMAALLAVDTRWAQLETEWWAMLDRHGLKAIHCSELRHQLGCDEGRVVRLMADVEAIVLRHVLVSVVGVMQKDDYDQIYKPTQPVSGNKHSRLGILYRACLSFFAAFLEEHAPDNLDEVRFIYECGPKEGGLQGIHAGFQRTDVPDWFGPLSFVAKADRVALQAADCLAAGALFHERSKHAADSSNIGVSTLVMTDPAPATLAAPLSFRLPVTRTILESLRDDLLLTKTKRAALRRSIMGGL